MQVNLRPKAVSPRKVGDDVSWCSSSDTSNLRILDTA